LQFLTEEDVSSLMMNARAVMAPFARLDPEE
jgi:hypothetical protein